MNHIPGFNFLVSLILSLTLLSLSTNADLINSDPAHQPVGATHNDTDGVSNLIQTVCQQVQYKQNCIANLQSDPDSKQADIFGLGSILLRFALNNATETTYYIKKKLSEQNMDPNVEQALVDCSEEYMDAIDQLDSSLASAQARVANDVELSTLIANTNVGVCDDTVKESGDHESELRVRNAIIKELCSNVLIMAKLMGAKNG